MSFAYKMLPFFCNFHPHPPIIYTSKTKIPMPLRFSHTPCLFSGCCSDMLMWANAILSNCTAWHSAKCQKRFALWQNRIDLHSVPVSWRRKMFHRIARLRMTILTLFLGEWLGKDYASTNVASCCCDSRYTIGRQGNFDQNPTCVRALCAPCGSEVR